VIRLVISGAPRTKKNSPQIVRGLNHPLLVPSKAFKAWEREALPQLRGAVPEPIAAPVQVSAMFYREANRGDLIGYMQALADVLEKAGVLVNDAQIVCWDGTRMTKDKDRPRVEVEIRQMEAA
jgi:Holliday junction resolvase RusA-like endonuclease